ncbi:MAG: hypothetical protein IJP78_01235 [Clostridia bacterium]|nr:hypothetical protein [Clostridia bacterium]
MPEKWKEINEIAEKCFDRLYQTITFIMSYYAIFSAAISLTSPDKMVIIAILNVFLPIGTYVIGLFYAFNLFSIGRATEYLLNLEKPDDWNHFCHGNRNNLFLPYGTGFMFFLFLPVLDYLIAYLMGYLITDFIAWILMGTAYATYFIFMAVILTNIFQTRKKAKEIITNHKAAQKNQEQNCPQENTKDTPQSKKQIASKC